jgi:hypothetical protein
MHMLSVLYDDHLNLGHYVDCHYAEISIGERQYTECYRTGRPYVDCRLSSVYAECQYAGCHYAICH